LLLTTALSGVAPFFVQTAAALNVVVTNTNDSGAGSLRAAITSVNASVDPANNITFGNGFQGQITLLSNLPTITKPVNIDFAGDPGIFGGNFLAGGFGTGFAAAGAVVTINNSHLYTGNTTLTAGTLRVGVPIDGSAVFGSGKSLLVMSAGTIFDIPVNTSATFQNISGNGTITNNGSGNGLTINGGNATPQTFAGTISGTGKLSLPGGGDKLTLSGSTTYSGDTNIFGDIDFSGTNVFKVELAAGATNALSPNSAFFMIGAGTLRLNGFNQTIGSLDGGTVSGAVPLVDLGAGTLTAGGNNTSTEYFGSIIGTGGLTKVGTGTMTLTSSLSATINSQIDYSGATLVSAGTLQAGNVNAFSPNSAHTVNAGAVLDLNNFNNTIASLAGAGNVTLGSGTLTTGGNNSSTTFSGVMSGTGGLTKVGTGTFILSGDNTFTGTTTISAGTLQLGNGGTGGAVVGNIVDNAILAINHSNTVTLPGVISGTGAVQQIGSGTTILTGNNAYTGGTTVTAGILQLGTAGTTSGIVGDVLVNNNGTFNVVNANTAGLTSITTSNLGLAQFFNATTASNATITIGGDVVFHDTSTAGNATIIVNTGSAGFRDSSTAGNAVITNNDVVGFSNSSSAGTATITNTSLTTFLDFDFTATAANSTINNNGGLTRFEQSATAGNAKITNDNGDIEFLNSATAGNAVITNKAGGFIEFFDTSTGGNARFINNAGGVFDMSGLTAAGMTAGSIEGAGNFFLGSKSLSVGGNNLSTTVSGVISDGGPNGGGVGGSLTKVGTGTLILTGTNTYTGGTTISAGTLQLGAGGPGATSGSIVGNVVDNGILAFARSDAMTFSGVISGTGAVAQIGQGITTLTGVNTYSGGTILNNGILAVSTNANLGAAAGGLTFNGGTLRALAGFNSSHPIVLLAPGGTIDTNGFNVDWGGVISGVGAFTGVGGLRKNGNGVLALTADNTYTGGTTINQGTLQLGNGGTSGSILGDVVNNAAFTINRSDTYTFGGLISGTGVFNQIGAGTTVFTSDNTYTGGTTISAGTLQLGNGGTTGSIVGDVTNNGTLAFNRSNALTFGGVISGTGAVQQNGTGSTNLTAMNTYTGATTVNAGTLFVNGSIASSSGLTVNAGGTVGGSGNLPKTTINGGTLSPGNSIGTVSINGSLTFVGAGNYIVEVSPAAADKTNVTGAPGTATLAGALSAVGTGGSYTAGTKYTVLNATGGVSGTFSSLSVSGSFGSTKPHVEYDASNVYLVLDPNALPLTGLTPNERSVATMINTVLQSGAGAPAVFTGLFNLSAAQLPGALDQLSGEVHSSTASVLLDESLYARSAILGRLRQAAYGGDTQMASLSSGGPMAYAGGEELTALAYAKSPIVTKAPPLVSQPSYDVVFWAQGFGGWGRFDTDGNAAAVRRDLAGFFSGVDTRVGTNGRLGIAAGYTGSRNALDNRGSSTVESGHLAGYGGWSFGNFNLRGGGDYAWHTIDTSRTVSIPGFFDNDTAHYNGSTAQIFGEAGYGFAFGKVAVEPFAGAAFVRLQTDGASERGGAAALNVAANSFEVGYSTLGIRAATTIPLAYDMMLVPRASAAWQHAFDTVTPADTLAFQAAGVPFAIAGVPIARDALLAEAGLDLAIGRSATIGIAYVGQIANNVQDHAAKGKFSWKF
jgi:outer membrane autotransporter protein